ncbi:hypothetical protein WK57_30365 [Burkholderia ubonensis]|uniref:HeH/LEM domain-containing protein n=1 Tax=Burkholderia ubonensis TaxID=101571 RepID=A0AA40UVI3_9BURK|nr:HeH/LEM domain-containing protein [Burkholderia ubonensis]KWZ53294.1 hypothetical protein WK57_30365 [Burkholderia ubonensis]
MKFLIYAALSSVVASAFADGLAVTGHAAHFRSIGDHATGETEPCDVVIVDGLRERGAQVLADFAKRGIPVVVADLGYVDRATGPTDIEGHWQLSVGGLNRLPSIDCPPDRLAKLGVEFGAPALDGVTIIAGQHVGDAAHPFKTAEEIAAWAEQMAEKIDGEVVFRPHPLSPNVCPNLPIDDLPLAESLARAKAVVAYTSNIGNDALLAGVQPIANGPAIWADVALDARDAYFAKLAYAQWTLAEIASGEAVRFLVDHALPGEPFDAADEAAADQAGGKLSVAEIRARLTALKIEFPATAKKAELAALLERALTKPEA